MEDTPGWMVALMAIAVFALLAMVVARCEHKPDNTVGYVVQRVETYSLRLSTYEMLEPGVLGDRIFIIDSTGKFSVNDTICFAPKQVTR